MYSGGHFESKMCQKYLQFFSYLLNAEILIFATNFKDNGIMPKILKLLKIDEKFEVHTESKMFCNFLNCKNALSVNGNACNLSYLHDSSSEKFINHYFSRTAALWTGFCLRHLGKNYLQKVKS